MMNRKTLLGGLMALSLMATLTAPALAEIFHKTITLGPGAGNFTMGDLGIGDQVVLTLVNPSNQPLEFQTTQNVGNEKSWVVQPHSSSTVNFTYTRPFDDDVEFVVKNANDPNSNIAQGTFMKRGTNMQTGQSTTTTEQSTSYQTTNQPQAGQGNVQGNNVNVRGYW